MAVPALQIPVGFSLDQAARDASKLSDSVGRTTRSISDQFEAMNGAIASNTSSAFGALAAAAAAAGVGVVAGVVGAINSLSKIGDLSEELRLPVNLIQALGVAASEARVPAADLTSALQKFTSASKLGGDDADKLNKALENIGENFKEAFQNAPTQAERLNVVANALKSTSDEVKRAQLALQVFGSDSERLLSLFDKGSAGIQGYVRQVFELGLAIDEAFVRQAQEARGKIELLSRVLGDKFATSLTGLIPLVTQIIGPMTNFLTLMRDVAGVFADDSTAPTGALENELRRQVDQWVRLKNAREALTDNKPGKFDTLRDQLREMLGIQGELDKDLAAVDEDITKTEARIEQIKKILASRNAAPAKKDEGPPAFQARPPLLDSKDAFDQQVESIERHIAALRADALAVGMTAAQHQTLRTEMALLQAVERAGGEVTNEQIDQYAQLRATMGAQQALAAAGINLSAQQAASFENVTARMAAAATASMRMRDNWQGLNSAVQFGGQQLVEIFDALGSKTQSLGDTMRSVFNSIKRSILEATFFGGGPLAGILGLKSNVAGGTGGLLGAIFGGFRAGGGGVEAGKVYAVNENTPNTELFVPGTGGTIVTPQQLRRAGGGGDSVMISYAPTIDARGVDGGQLATLAGIIAKDKANFVKNVEGAIGKIGIGRPGALR